MSDRPQTYAETEFPLGGYSVLLGSWMLVFGGSAWWLARSGRLPARVPLADAALLGLATHKITRLIAKDWVTSPLRAPFVRYVGPASGGEVREEARGRGMRRAIGDLVTCPYCTGPWAAGGLGVLYAVSPSLARLTALTFSAVTVSDFLHRAHERDVSRTSRVKQLAEAR